MEQNREQQNNGENPMQGYDPTERNFQRTANEDDALTGETGVRKDEESLDSDPPLTEQDLEETGLSDEEADDIEWEEPQDGEPRGE